MLPDKITLAQAVCTRLCHDLGGPAGALAGALELLEGTGEDALDVARDAARIIDRRIRFFRAAIGAACGDCRLDEIAQMAEGLTLGRRAQVDLSDLQPNIVLPAHLVQALLLAMWAAIDALPRGGCVRVGGDVEGGVSVWPDGQGAGWPPGLAAGIAGDDVPLTARGVAVPLLLAVTAMSGIRVELLLGGPSGAAPLLMTAETRN
jgi:histidine phosphotransferase ChpT